MKQAQAILLLSIALIAGCQMTRPQQHASSQASEPDQSSGPTTIEITAKALHTQVKRLGINLSGQTFYDSGQMMRNLIFRNPGFEGQTWQSILRCKSVSETTCTDENVYAVWPRGFLDGAAYTVISGSGRGGQGRVTGTIPAVSGQQGVTLTLDPAPNSISPGDFLIVRADKPGDATAGWWTSQEGGASFATETHDLAPGSPGRQALRIDAASAVQSAHVVSYFDTFAGRSFVQLRGVYTLRFRAKSLFGKPSLHLSVERLDTVHGLHRFLDHDVPLTSRWQDFHFEFRATEDRSAIGPAAVRFDFSATSALLDDVSLEEGTPDTANPTAFRGAVVHALRELHPGVLRYMDNGADFGSSIDNMLAMPFARQRTGSSTQNTSQDDIPIGLGEFLALAKAVGAEPWFAMPAGTSPDEAAHLVEYLAGPATSAYGSLRSRVGQTAPWTEVFQVIHLELGNELWNSRSFAGNSIADPKAYGQRATDVFRGARASRFFRPASFDLILGSWAALPWWTEQELATSTQHDSAALAPYQFTDFNDARSEEAIFGPMFAQPEQVDSRPGGLMSQQARTAASAAHPARLAVYETNLGPMSGTANQSQIDRTIPSLGAGLAAIDHMLLMLRDLGVTTQCLFALPEYINGFGAGEPKRTMPLWGAVVDMGGATDLRRPSYLAEQLANEAILATEVDTRIEGTNPTWDQPLSTNDKIALRGVHLIQSFAFADGKSRSLILLNLSRTRTLPVRLSGSERPRGMVELNQLTAAAITDSNEQTEKVRSTHQRLAGFRPSDTLTLPPYSMTTLLWSAP